MATRKLETRSQRLQLLHSVIDDPDVTPAETLKYTYNALMYEIAVNRRDRARRMMSKYGKRQNNALKVFRFRQELNDL